jgi:hypothetical protein
VFTNVNRTVSWKCTPLVIDSTLNTIYTVCLNVYQIFIFCAMKFHCLVKKSLFIATAAENNERTKQSCTFFTEVISDVIGYMWVSVQSRKRIIESMGSTCELTEQKVQYMGLKAFYTVLNRKQSYYAARVPTLLPQLKQIFEGKTFRQLLLLGDNQELMKEVTDPVNSFDLLQKIKF